MQRRSLLAAPALLPLAAALPAAAQPAGVAFEEALVPGGSPGVELYVRNKRPEAGRPGRPDRVVVCLHGSSYPSSTSYDLSLAGVSWMDYIAGRGFDVWSVDLRGYGRSTRPPAMAQPADRNPPVGNAEESAADLAAALRHIRRVAGVQKTVLMGWSYGTTLAALHAQNNPGEVERIVMLGPRWLDRATEGQGDPLGAWRPVTRAEARQHWLREVPDNKRRDLIPLGWFEHWADTTFATDPEGSRQVPSVLRVPTGSLIHTRETWFSGRPAYDPGRITCPVLLVTGEWDRDTPTAMAANLFPLLTNAPGKRQVVLAEGTHMMMLERNRGALFQSVQVFLEEAIA
ncbi:alpha/beta hydrolase [Roseomonas sp. CCTCC AB2023176]|uniref:alpha/beta hydrolase n=1 Tax=Roseomonas sp. CCTCC AB2023176 TaxID=3342640 RepID=UPI0035D94FD9